MKTKRLCLGALGIALYVALSMVLKIPIAGHAALDLGYIVLAVYCYYFGPLAAACVGGLGCMLVSMLTSGWFPPGWMVANIFIGLFIGYLCKIKAPMSTLIFMAFLTTFVAMLIFKMPIECFLYKIPVAVKLPKTVAVGIVDAVTMCAGIMLAPKIPIKE